VVVRRIGGLQDHGGKGWVEFHDIRKILDGSIGAQCPPDRFRGDHGQGREGVECFEAVSEDHLVDVVGMHKGQPEEEPSFLSSNGHRVYP